MQSQKNYNEELQIKMILHFVLQETNLQKKRRENFYLITILQKNILGLPK